MATTTDEQFRAQLGHLLRATELPVSPDPALQGAIDRAREGCSSSRDALVLASLAIQEDNAQNRAAALAVDLATRASVEEFSWLKTQARALWMDLKPAQRAALSEAELSARQERFERIFSDTPSDLLSLGTSRAVERLGAARDLLRATPELTSLAIDFLDHVEQLEAAASALAAEARDDAPLFEALQQARQRCHQHHVATRLLIEAVLRLDGSAESVEAFILRRSQPKPSEASEPSP